MQKPLDDLIKRKIKDLLELKENYKDHVPATMVHSDSEDPMYKCRTAWWSSFLKICVTLSDFEIIPEEYTKRRILLFEEYHATKRENNGRVKQENIDAANKLVDDIFLYLMEKGSN